MVRKTALKSPDSFSQQDKESFLIKHRTQKKRSSFLRTELLSSNTPHAEKALFFFKDKKDYDSDAS
ncbi:hypothetical protein [Virgibacillus proomii]|uniref:hypothetical protein n=1 Tax=Virgibacillus proomii TaxID=84407 RepID=UPI00117EE62E|nr:hypothetical protein [Virgibacillus proomii]